MQRPESHDTRPELRELFPSSQKRGSQTKQRIMEALAESIATLGVSGASCDEIAKRAHVTKSQLAYHFGGKHELLPQALVYVTSLAQRITTDAVRRAKSPQAAVLAVVE